MSRAPRHIVDDLGRKLHDDVTAAARRTASLVADPNDRATICFLAFGSVLGMSLGFFELGAGHDLDPERLADALWETRVRPMVLGVMRGDSAESIVGSMRGVADG
ncbi:MAG: hypothetical protein ACXW27_08990 [Allosphingosinicella sp.]